jgi:xanthine dehydrogenase FAD-binding subunit
MNFKVESPQNAGELLRTIAALQGSRFRFGAGYTDLLLLLEKQPLADLTIINLNRLQDDRFTAITVEEGGIRIGALATAAMLIDDPVMTDRFPVLTEAAASHASRQIRQVATVGGNLCTASPAGDMACALVALRAECEILSANGAIRTVPLERFFTGLRRTDLRSNEILRSIFVPLLESGSVAVSTFIKVGTRRSMECAVVSLACHIVIDAEGTIMDAGAAIGSAAPVTKFTGDACALLIGRALSDITPAIALDFANLVVSYATPITDIRGSAWYRTEVLRNISRSIFERPSVLFPSVGSR